MNDFGFEGRPRAAGKQPRTKHPGRTRAERKVIDAIGGGNHSPPMRDMVRERMIEDRLIERIEDRVIPDRLGEIRIVQVDLPLAVHMQWCNWCSENIADEDA